MKKQAAIESNEVLVPILGPYQGVLLAVSKNNENYEYSTVKKWLKNEGDSVRKNEPVILIHCPQFPDAQEITINATESGILLYQLVSIDGWIGGQHGEHLLGIIKSTKHQIQSEINIQCEHPFDKLAIKQIDGLGFFEKLNRAKMVKQWFEKTVEDRSIRELNSSKALYGEFKYKIGEAIKDRN